MNKKTTSKIKKFRVCDKANGIAQDLITWVSEQQETGKKHRQVAEPCDISGIPSYHGSL